MRIILSFLLAVMVTALVPNAPARASAVSSVTVFSTLHGVRLSLSVPRRSYPANALVRAVITVRNTTRHTVWVNSGGPPMPDGFVPQVALFDQFRQPVNTSVLDLFLWYPGPRPAPNPVRAGAQVRFPRYVVLRGPTLQTGIEFQLRPPGVEPAGRHSNMTPRLHLTLTAADTPTVALRTIGGQLTASLHYPDIAAHSLRFEDSAQCGPASDPNDVMENPLWVPVSRLNIVPGCENPTAWRAVAGTLNHSVAWIRYGPGA